MSLRNWGWGGECQKGYDWGWLSSQVRLTLEGKKGRIQRRVCLAAVDAHFYKSVGPLDCVLGTCRETDEWWQPSIRLLCDTMRATP